MIIKDLFLIVNNFLTNSDNDLVYTNKIAGFWEYYNMELRDSIVNKLVY